MAIDEALFRFAASEVVSVARFYQWDHPAVTIGYFGKASDQADTVARRLTGGGRVEHGEDLTMTLAFPAGTEVAAAPAAERYRWIHTTIAAALAEAGEPVILHDGGFEKSESCFAAPVPWDLLDPRDGRKIGGGALRRSRGAVIYQGSFRLSGDFRRIEAPWIDSFLGRIAADTAPLDPRHCFSLELAVPAERLAAP